MKTNIIILFQLFFAMLSHAQPLILQGKIYFERSENMHKQLDEDSEGEWAREAKKRLPKNRTDIFELTFNKDRTFYKLFKEEENKEISTSWWRVAWDNTVSRDFKMNQMVREKTVYEKSYRITDTLPMFDWKIQGEYRDIAGFACRKATTILFDSLYVIAFYTEQIPVAAGPESFGELPGMILGLVIPRLHYTFFAQKVESVLPIEKDFIHKPLKRVAHFDNKKMMQEIGEAVEDWGKYGRKIYWKCVF